MNYLRLLALSAALGAAIALGSALMTGAYYGALWALTGKAPTFLVKKENP